MRLFGGCQNQHSAMHSGITNLCGQEWGKTFLNMSQLAKCVWWGKDGRGGHPVCWSLWKPPLIPGQWFQLILLVTCPLPRKRLSISIALSMSFAFVQIVKRKIWLLIIFQPNVVSDWKSHIRHLKGYGQTGCFNPVYWVHRSPRLSRKANKHMSLHANWQFSHFPLCSNILQAIRSIWNYVVQNQCLHTSICAKMHIQHISFPSSASCFFWIIHWLFLD